MGKKWEIISSVTPSPLINSNYKPEYLDPHSLSTLKKYMKTLKKKSPKKGSNNKPNINDMDNDGILKKIKCNKKVCDIADFLEMWTEFEVKNKRKDKPYNAVSHNCQQFALHLFKYLVGTHYPEKVQSASKQTQSPADIKAYKKESKNKPNNKKIYKQNDKQNVKPNDKPNDKQNE